MSTLLLIPTPLGDDAMATLPQYVLEVVHTTAHFVVENAKTARHFLKNAKHPLPLPILQMVEWNKHERNDAVIATALQWLREGNDVGILSEAGCPAVADPGSAVVEAAYSGGFKVMPLVGPSSILLALQASGMNGQQFAFVGYVSNKSGQLANDLKRLEVTSQRLQQTQIFIEAPYRNMNLIASTLQTLSPTTKFCIAANLTLPNEYIATKTIAEWRKLTIPDLHKQPAIFLLQAAR
ncbi:MAG: SAM-dependent methyltransferase [Saprospiraceae bacterium]|nr:SAM-dependent methyltransferase [Saprospiraceae bacterium]MBP7680212.1 SAM-dependent methyltransferase [Saprospiraceae bacterium]